MLISGLGDQFLVEFWVRKLSARRRRLSSWLALNGCATRLKLVRILLSASELKNSVSSAVRSFNGAASSNSGKDAQPEIIHASPMLKIQNFMIIMLF